MSETVLVTGGAGFLGYHLCKALVEQGKRVICLDNLLTGSVENVQALQHHSRFAFVEQDVCAPLDIEVGQIYNLACPASPRLYQRDPVRTTRTSVEGAINMLELSLRCDARILQASTSEVYGDPQVNPQPETYWGHVNSIGPRGCYNEGKRCAETLFFDYYRQHRTRIKIARIFNTYGPRMDPFDGRVVSNFIRQALAGDPLTLHGDGNQFRSFCYVDDMVDGLVRCMETADTFIGPVNIGNPEPCSITTLADKIIKMTGSLSPVINLPLPADDPLQRCPDIYMAKKHLGWTPTTTLDYGLERTIEWFSSLRKSQAGYAP